MKSFMTFWKAFTYTDGRFSRSGFLRTLFSFQLMYAFSWSVYQHVPNHGITWELILFVAIGGAYFLADYRVIKYLTAMKQDDSYETPMRRGSEKTEDFE